MDTLEYLMKFNTVSLYWDNLRFSIIIILLRSFTSLKFQVKADYQSHAITLVHPETIINFCYSTLTQPDVPVLSVHHTT